ncbi:beta family protein [Niallia sp. MER TA 168]|uniref:beta family protein n=1 Tax=Niallia sp. MER TA 168 TaxID=2939568 RepID=UPI00203F528D|nr:beta family protein [Niallia sp. MER TA 168]MCM3363172.1 beta family protein [Niallia sp. MER TA 168]
MYYYPLLKNANNEMKALRELNEDTKTKIRPVIESKRIKPENVVNWEATYKTLGKYLKERVGDTKFIYDFNCAFEDLGEAEELKNGLDQNLVQHCLEKMESANLSVIPCFQHDSPAWLVKSVLQSGYNEIAIRIRCHDFQESFNPFVVSKLKYDLEAANMDDGVKITLILDFFDKETSLNRIQNTISEFSSLNPSHLVYLATSCPENANAAAPNALTEVGARKELNHFINLRTQFSKLDFGDYTTRLKGEILKGFNHYNSYIKIFYTTETHYWIAKSKLIGDDGEFTFHEICKELIDQDFYPGREFSFGDEEIYKCANQELIIGDHQSPIAISVNHHIETTVAQLLL